MSRRDKYRYMGLVAAISILGLANLAIWGHYREVTGRVLSVSFLNIGQGDSIFIESPSGRQALIDSGPGGGVLAELGEVMPWHDRSLDVLIETHPDSDHDGAFGRILDIYETSFFLESGYIKDTATYKNLRLKIAERDIPTISLRRGMKVDLGGGVLLNILYPDRETTQIRDTNDASIVARLTYLDHSFLLTGDATTRVEGRILSYGKESLISEVLKLGHHGSKTSSGALFLAAVSPSYAVISVGRKNRYGHPHAEVLERVESQDIKIFRTDEQGRVTFTVNRAGEMNIASKK